MQQMDGAVEIDIDYFPPETRVGVDKSYRLIPPRVVNKTSDCTEGLLRCVDRIPNGVVVCNVNKLKKSAFPTRLGVCNDAPPASFVAVEDRNSVAVDQQSLHDCISNAVCSACDDGMIRQGHLNPSGCLWLDYRSV